MKESDLVPVGKLAMNFGAKCVIYGPPGGGKTPISIETSPNPVVLVCEPGMLSVRNSQKKAWLGNTPARIKEFFEWLDGSNERRKYDTVVVDSGSQLAEIILKQCEADCKDGRQVYGELSKRVMKYMNQLFYMQNMNVVIICKEMKVQEIVWNFSGPMPKKETITKRYPYFPGQDLNIKVPHLFDDTLFIKKGEIPGFEGEHTYIRTFDDEYAFGRDRSSKLSKYEQPNLTALFKKIMS